MRPLALALSLTLTQPCSLALAGSTEYVYLIAPLEKPSADATQRWPMSPYLTVDTGRSFETLQNALAGLRDPEKDLGLDEADVIVSALKAANGSERDLQDYLESQMGYSMKDAARWTEQNLPRAGVQKLFTRARDARERMVRGAVGWTAVGLGMGGILTSLPLALTGVGLLPALALAQISSSIVETGIDVLRDPKLKSVVDRKMPDLMVALLGPELSRPGTRVSAWQFTYGPENELVKRLRHAALLRNTLTKVGTPELMNLPTERAAVLKTAEELYANDVVVGAMVLSVLSRQLDGGTRIFELTKLIAALPEDQLTPFAQMAEALGRSGDAMLGIATYDQDNQRDERRREVQFTAAWAQIAVLTRANAGFIPAATLHRATERALGPDAKIDDFDVTRAGQTVAATRAGTTHGDPAEGRLARARARWRELLDRAK